jgi:CRP/FNR family transcriptional regulator, anaerobic regulatory protein
MPEGCGSVAFNGCQLRLRTLSREVAEEDLAWAAALKTATVAFPQNRDLVQAGQVGGNVQVLQRGWAFRYKQWPDGARQILGFLLPGDLIGIESGLLGIVEHSVRSLTDVELCTLDGRRLDELFRNHTRLALAIAKHLSLESRRMDTRYAVIGRRSALERMAFLMLDLYERQRRGPADEARCAFPLRRQHIADATGLTGAHVNRILNQMRKERLASVADGALTIHDFAALRDLAGAPFGANGNAAP